MHALSQATLALYQQIFSEYDNIFVAYSGGVDSTVLLHSVCSATLSLSDTHQPSKQIFAIHINHGLSPFADNWQAHCLASCEQLGVEMLSAQLTIKKQSRQSLEAIARNKRYQAIDELVLAYAGRSLVLLGQHLDDQAETFLLQLKRGAGPKGLSAMPQRFISAQQVHYQRPLLAVPRQSIQDYAHQHALTWVEDESNQDTQFDRNFLRQQVMPLLTKRWPKFTASAARSASLCAEQESVLSELMLEQLASIEASERRLNLRQLATHSDASQKILVRAWLNKYGHDMPSAAVLNEILTMHEVSIDADPIIALAQGQIRRYAEHLYLLTNGELEQINLAASFQAYDLSIDEQGEQIYAQWGFAISAQNCTENNSCKADIDALNVTFGRFSRRLKCHADRPNKSLKTWMQEWQIPPWQRASIPVICSADEIVCVILPHGQLKPNLDYQHNSDHGVFIKPL